MHKVVYGLIYRFKFGEVDPLNPGVVTEPGQLPLGVAGGCFVFSSAIDSSSDCTPSR